MKAKINILVGEGCQYMRLGVVEGLIKPQDDLVLLGYAEKVLAVVELYESQKPDLLLLPLNIPCPSLPERIAAISEACPELNILILTPCQDGPTVRAMLEAGAKGYALSSESTGMILSAIHQVAQGKSWISPALGHLLATPQQPSVSQRALQILRLLARGKTDNQISAILKIAKRTIRYHLDKIYDVLHVESRTRTEAVAIASRLKLV